jgi:3-methylfumaryl-CoA hydratase
VTVTRSAVIDPSTVEAYRGTFAAAEAPLHVGDDLPAGWEGVSFPFAVPLADLRPDGTPARDGVVPEIDLPRRMYAGEDTEFVSAVRLGDTVRQTTALGPVVEKTGRNGRLTFVDVEREYAVDGAVAIRSVWHDVFLEDAGSPARDPKRDPAAAASAEWIETVTLDIRQLFRFSALTFNTHLIHYDRAWAREREGLPDLLVHGPLTRILMMDAARRRTPGRTPRRLSVRAVAPVLVDREIRFAGRSGDDATTVTALDADDVVLAVAEVAWA